ncbi:ATP-dependent Clp protease proteolytic subunit [Methylobrevis sp. L22]|uniref:ATP-dependent Clp protease proteolytic subunit n=2 Tax=Methylobrevis albus TaxID=2793297 RepID=A0A931I1H9_9HYPH|nr:ATP-dependent Clp protease proteolytic subunit [Methylobrevis albus]
MPVGAPRSPAGWAERLRRRPDETVLRVVFGAMLVATVVVVGGDLLGISGTHPADAALPAEEAGPARPFLPTVSPVPPGGAQDADRNAQLSAAMRFELGPDGRLAAIGTITPGTAGRLEQELALRGDYVTTVVLDSPGGSVRDAIAMGQLIRSHGYGTLVGDGGYCASSCPLVFAGGVTRRVSPDASVGVHQVLSVSDGPVDAARDMNEVQRVSAECQRHLYEMGVDPRVWMHAMETPFESLFYFAGEEMVELKLATAIEG